MIPDERFLRETKRFWANVRLLSEHIGYTQKPIKKGGESAIRIPTLDEVSAALTDRGLTSEHISTSEATLTPFGTKLFEYFQHRAAVLNNGVKVDLMNAPEAKREFETLRKKLTPKCPLPMNKQKGKKKAPAYLTGIVNMLVEAHADGLPCNYDPLELTTFTKDREPVRTLARRVDGAFPSTVNPVAIWEIKEYYYTTTFGSRVADGVYESLLDGLELENLAEEEGIQAKHCLIIDARDTWWKQGKSYLCRIVDMLHMGYVDEVLFGREALRRLPVIVPQWVSVARAREKSSSPPVSTPRTTNI